MNALLKLKFYSLNVVCKSFLLALDCKQKHCIFLNMHIHQMIYEGCGKKATFDLCILMILAEHKPTLIRIYNNLSFALTINSAEIVVQFMKTV